MFEPFQKRMRHSGLQCVESMETNEEAAGATRLSRYHYIAIEGSLAGRYRQPSLRGVKRRSNLGRGGAGRPLCTLRMGSASKSARTIPRPPSLEGRGIIMNSGGHPQTPANGAAPLWTPRLHVLGAATGPPQRGRGRAVIARSEATKQSGAGRGGAAALHTPHGERLKECSDHPPTPFLGRKGHNNELWGTPPDPCQRGCAPLDSPLTRAGGQPQGPPNGAAGGPSLRGVKRRSNLAGRGGAAALHTPHEERLKECSDHPPDPLPGRKGA